MGDRIKFKILTIAASVIVVVLLIHYFFVANSILIANKFITDKTDAMHMNALYQLENGFYSEILANQSINHSGSGPLYDNPNNTLGFFIVKKRESNCNVLIGVLNTCPKSIYTRNTIISLNDSGSMQLSTRLYRNNANAMEEFSLLLSAINSSKNAQAVFNTNQIDSLGSNVGPYVSQYAVMKEPYSYNASIWYLGILVLRRDNIVLISQVLSRNQSFNPKIAQLTQSEENMSYLINNYYLN